MDCGYETACMIFQGALDTDGYGAFSLNGQTVKAHQYSWERRHGPIPDGQVPDHLCRIRRCVRTEHLELVTNKENTRRGEGPTAINARKTHCLHGHPFDSTNTLRLPGDRRGCRLCRNGGCEICAQRKRAAHTVQCPPSPSEIQTGDLIP